MTTLTVYLPFLELGNTTGVPTSDVPRMDEGASESIDIPGGFPFGPRHQTVAYVNKVLSPIAVKCILALFVGYHKWLFLLRKSSYYLLP